MSISYLRCHCWRHPLFNAHANATYLHVLFCYLYPFMMLLVPR